jgi:uncharacterized protein GlcG (DUF336 family)
VLLLTVASVLFAGTGSAQTTAAAAAAAVKPAAPATLAKVAISPDATKRSKVIEINVETAMQLINECIAFSRSLNPTGGATVVVLGISGNIVASVRTDGQIPNNFDSAYNKAKTALYMRQPSRVVSNRWGAPEPYLARAPLDLYLVEGGYPIIVEDLLIGAIGVGGAAGDEECGHVALTKVLGPQPPIVPAARPPAGAAGGARQ